MLPLAVPSVLDIVVVTVVGAPLLSVVCALWYSIGACCIRTDAHVGTCTVRSSFVEFFKKCRGVLLYNEHQARPS